VADLDFSDFFSSFREQAEELAETIESEVEDFVESGVLFGKESEFQVDENLALEKLKEYFHVIGNTTVEAGMPFGNRSYVVQVAMEELVKYLVSMNTTHLAHHPYMGEVVAIPAGGN